METIITTTRERAIGALRRYLNIMGYEVEGTWEQDGLRGLVASDKSELAFVQVRLGNADDDGEPEATESARRKFERAAIGWLADNEERYDDDLPVRFDVISLLLISRKRMLLRHQIDALNAC